MKRLALLVFSFMFIQLCFGQSQKELYQAWLDSMKSDSYIGIFKLLDEVVITDSARLAALKDPRMQGNMRSTDDLMHSLSGVNMIRRGNFANEPMLRGLTSERYILAIDGMRIYGACTDKMDPASSYIEPINMDHVEISFGSKNNMMGSGTGGGVNFGLKKPIFALDDPLRVSLQSSFSSVSRGFDQALDLNYAKDKWAMRISGVHRKAENYTDGNGEEVKYSQFEKFNYSTSINYRVTNQSLIAFDFIGDDASDVGYPALPMDVSLARAKMFGLSYMTDKLWGLKEPQIKVYHNFINHEMDDTKRDSVAMHMDMPGNTRTTGAFIQGFISQTDKSTLEIKADYHKSFWHAEMTMYPNDPNQLPMFMLTWPDIHRSITGLEVSNSYTIKPSHQLITGGRVEAVNSFISSDFGEAQLSVFDKSGVDPRNKLLMNASAQYLLGFTSASTANFTLAYGERVPTVSEQYGFYLFNRQDGYDYLGDPDLEKERNIQLEIGQKTDKGSFKFSTALFAYLFDDYIMGVYDPSLSNMTIGALGVKWYRNTGKSMMFGGEMSLENQLPIGISSRLNLNYVYGQDFEGEPLPQMPPFKVTYSLLKSFKGWNLQPEVVWSSAQNRISEKFNERSTDSFFLVNLAIAKTKVFKPGNLMAGLSFTNLFDQAYREHFDIGNILRPGLSIDLQLKWQFN
jgi:iron complex outermembrane receptor protein